MIRKRKSPPQPHHSRRQCPCCGKRFVNVLRHLNHRESTCASWFDKVPPLHNSPQHSDDDDDDKFRDPMEDDVEPVLQGSPPESLGERSSASSQQSSFHHVQFPGAGITYGRTTSFMDRFNSDQHSGSRVENVYYPFAGKDEWELASFLHSSGLSMRKVDDFLKLKMVITNNFYCLFTVAHRSI
jgi:hypothetical protein